MPLSSFFFQRIFSHLRARLPARLAAAGDRGEQAAARYLQRQGYHILARNLATRLGEIDLVCQAPDGRTLVIVEVKAAQRHPGGGSPRPEQHVNWAKERKLSALAAQLVRRFHLEDRPVRFDVIGVDLASDPRLPPVIRHHPAAFNSTL